MALKNPIKYVVGDWSTVPEAKRRAWVRMRIKGRFQYFRERVKAESTEPATSGDPGVGLFHISRTTVLQELTQHGLSAGLNLPANELAEIDAYARARPFALNGRSDLLCRLEDYEVAARDHDLVATHGLYPSPHLDCPAIARVHGDPDLRAIARAYLGSEPASHDVKLMWSFAAHVSSRQQARLAQKFHFDLDDYRFIKFFFYITPVSSASGPHLYVRGSHRSKPLWDQLFMRRFSDRYIERVYGKQSIVELCGPAGFGFVEDTYGVHKGLPPANDRRLLLQFEFATVDYGARLL